MRLAVVIFFCSLASAVYSAPQEDPELARLARSLEAARTQGDMNAASAKIAEYWDRQLLAIEKRIETKLDSSELKKFSESKDRWRRYRSEEVSFRAGFFEGGSAQRMIANGHYAMLTEHRVIELEALWTDALSN